LVSAGRPERCRLGMVISSRNRHGGKASQSKRSISRAEKQAKQPSKSPIKTMRLAAKVTGWSACLVGDLPINNHSGPFIRGMRACHTCHHLRRPEIDRRLAAGEPLAWADDIESVSPPHQLPETRLIERHRQGGGARHRGAYAVAVERDAQRRLSRAARSDRSDRDTGSAARIAGGRGLRAQFATTDPRQPRSPRWA
jgi:hypothetical protein